MATNRFEGCVVLWRDTADEEIDGRPRWHTKAVVRASGKLYYVTVTTGFDEEWLPIEDVLVREVEDFDDGKIVRGRFVAITIEERSYLAKLLGWAQRVKAKKERGGGGE